MNKFQGVCSPCRASGFAYFCQTTLLSHLGRYLCLQELSQKLIVVVGSDPLSIEAQRNATTTFMTHLRATLASKRVLGEYK